jgi:hypothetical protein
MFGSVIKAGLMQLFVIDQMAPAGNYQDYPLYYGLIIGRGL